MSFVPFHPPLQGQQRQPSNDQPRVLYVEDEDLNWEITQHELDGRYQLTRAKTAQEAFLLLAKNSYHLILMDIQLSNSQADGLAITRILKGRHEGPLPLLAQGIKPIDTPIIFVTAYQARYNKAELITAGGADLLTKPVNFTQLSFAIARVWARGSREQRQNVQR
jgi:CheY-like chemotaxis protein